MSGLITRRNYTANQSGDVFAYRKAKTIKDYRNLANVMAMGETSNYPAGLSPCFVAGINGDWDDDGYCPVSKMDMSVCTCEDKFKAPAKDTKK